MSTIIRAAGAVLRGDYFNEARKTLIHMVQLVLVITLIVVTGVRVGTKPAGIPMTRSDTLGIVMGVKTIVFMIYQLATTHVGRLHRWASLKVYAILNTLEILFWLVVIIITFMSISSLCQGLYCGLSWVIVLLAFVIWYLSFWSAVVSYKIYRSSKNKGEV